MSELARRFRIDPASFGAADPVVIEQFFKNGIRGGRRKAHVGGVARCC
jgi:hypothetical protein